MPEIAQEIADWVAEFDPAYLPSDVLHEAKPTFTKPAPADLRRDIASRCDAVIEALAD